MTTAKGRSAMATPGLAALVDDLFGELGEDSFSRPYKPEDREAEAAKIARLRQLRLATTPAPTRKRGLAAAH
jgi:hypothetical protein